MGECSGSAELHVSRDPRSIAESLRVLADEPLRLARMRELTTALAESRRWSNVAEPSSRSSTRRCVMADVLIAGASGQRNPGDEAILGAFLRALPDHDVVVTSRDPAGTEATHGCRAVDVRRPATVAATLRRCDAVVFGGGTVFKTLHPASGRGRLALVRNAAAWPRSCECSASPWSWPGWAPARCPIAGPATPARLLVRGSDLLVLRDEESACVLAEAGVPTPMRVGADVTWTSLDRPSRPRRRRGIAVVVVLSHLAGGSETPAIVANAVRALNEYGLYGRPPAVATG